MTEIDPILSILVPAAITFVSFLAAILIYRHFTRELDKADKEKDR